MGRLPAVLAIDGGNSKADLALLADDGTTLAVARREGFSHQSVGLEEAASRLREVVTELSRSAGLDGRPPVARVGAFCLAGLDLPIDDEQLGAMLDELGLCERWTLRNDVFAVLRCVTREAGIAVVCGAGLNCVGVDDEGTTVRYPALGELSGDLATGGRWLGWRALAMAVRDEDGRGPPTRLRRLVPRRFGLERPLQVTEAVYTGELDEARLLELAPVVMEAAAGGDEVAASLVDAVADEIVSMVRATRDRMHLGDRSIPIVLGGGLFRATDGYLRRKVARGVRRVAPGSQLHVLREHPVVGAALLGYDLLGSSGVVAPVVRRCLTSALDAVDLHA